MTRTSKLGLLVGMFLAVSVAIATGTAPVKDGVVPLMPMRVAKKAPKEAPRETATATTEESGAPGAGGSLSTDATVWKDASQTHLLWGYGLQMSRGHLSGVVLNVRLPVVLPFELRPELDTGLYFHFEQTYLTVPLTVGVVRPVYVSGSSQVVAGLNTGVLVTNEGARANDMLLLGVLGAETKLGTMRPFVQFRVGLRGSSLAAFPRIGLIADL